VSFNSANLRLVPCLFSICEASRYDPQDHVSADQAPNIRLAPMISAKRSDGPLSLMADFH
jgi:hypothetical protein